MSRVVLAARCLALMLVLVPRPVSAQPVVAGATPGPSSSDESPDGELSSDRPGVNAPAAVVGAGVVQIELGWSAAWDDEDGRTSEAPQPLLRYGLHRAIELQFSSDGLAGECLADCRWRASDLSVGARVVLPGEPFGATLALTGSLSLPTGAEAVSSGHVDPLAVVHVDRPLGPTFALSYNYQITRQHDAEDAPAVQHGHGLSLQASVARWSPFVTVARRPSNEDGHSPWLAEAGSAVRLGRDAQIDVSVARGINAAEPNWRLSAGLVLRRRPRAAVPVDLRGGAQ